MTAGQYIPAPSERHPHRGSATAGIHGHSTIDATARPHGGRTLSPSADDIPDLSRLTLSDRDGGRDSRVSTSGQGRFQSPEPTVQTLNVTVHAHASGAPVTVNILPTVQSESDGLSPRRMRSQVVAPAVASPARFRLGRTLSRATPPAVQGAAAPRNPGLMSPLRTPASSNNLPTVTPTPVAVSPAAAASPLLWGIHGQPIVMDPQPYRPGRASPRAADSSPSLQNVAVPGVAVPGAPFRPPSGPPSPVSPAPASPAASDNDEAGLEDHADEYIAPRDATHNHWYVVTAGRRVGIFREWNDMAAYVIRVPGNHHKQFRTRADAERHYYGNKANGLVEVILE
ncbi:hypothetical protein C8Q76DRAFT_687844 [Earliella scabrosa]|nr:hypothetical protein C8Q76DRAFT_687844 [Earliella scabrosa]